MKLEVSGAQAKALFCAIKSMWQHDVLASHYKRVRIGLLDDEHLDVYYRNQFTEVTVWWPVDVRGGAPGETYEVDADTVGRFLSDKGGGSLGLEIEEGKMVVTDYQVALDRQVYPDLKLPERLLGVYFGEEELELLGRVRVDTLRAMCERLKHMSVPKQQKNTSDGVYSCFWLGPFNKQLYAVSTNKEAAVELRADWELNASTSFLLCFEIEVARQLHQLAELWSVRRLTDETWCSIYRRPSTDHILFNLAGYGTEVSMLTPTKRSGPDGLYSVVPNQQASGLGVTISVQEFQQLLQHAQKAFSFAKGEYLQATISAAQGRKMRVVMDTGELVGEIDIADPCWVSLPGRKLTMNFTPRHFLHLMHLEDGTMKFKFNLGEAVPLRADTIAGGIEINYLGMPAVGGCHE